MAAETVAERLRRFLLALAGFIFLVTILELLLQDHTAEPLQLVPFGLCVGGGIAVAAALRRPGRPTLVALRVVMLVVALGGLLGMGIHLLGNYNFEREIRPNAAAAEAILTAFKGVSPLLAPGILVFAAMVALAATYYHPALQQPQQR